MSLANLARRVVRGFRLARYDLSPHARTGRIYLGAGLAFDPELDLTLERGVTIARDATFQGGGRLRIGADTYVGAFASIHCFREVRIGSDCLLGNFVSIIDNDHATVPGTLVRLQPYDARPVAIGNDCWIGEKATILAGVTVGDGAVVAAGSVVRADVPAGAVVAGVPARIVRMRA